MGSAAACSSDLVRLVEVGTDHVGLEPNTRVSLQLQSGLSIGTAAVGRG